MFALQWKKIKILGRSVDFFFLHFPIFMFACPHSPHVIPRILSWIPSSAGLNQRLWVVIKRRYTFHTTMNGKLSTAKFYIFCKNVEFSYFRPLKEKKIKTKIPTQIFEIYGWSRRANKHIFFKLKWCLTKKSWHLLQSKLRGSIWMHFVNRP